MNKSDIQIWLNNLRQAWMNADLDEVKNIFQKTTYYYETPFSKPVSADGIWNLWQDVKQDDLDYLEYDILAIENNNVIVNERFSWQGMKRDGIYLLKFDTDGFCIFFKRWKITE